MKRTIRWMAVALLLLAISGCWDHGIFDCDCDDERSDVRAHRGNPEEVEQYDSHCYDIETWWYWSQGVSYTFVETCDDCCEMTIDTFPPIQPEK